MRNVNGESSTFMVNSGETRKKMSLPKTSRVVESLKTALEVHDIVVPDSVMLSAGELITFPLADDSRGLITADLSIEKNRLTQLSKKISPIEIGYKAMAAAITKIAARGGRPEYAFISVGLPELKKEDFIHRIYQGVHVALADTNISLIGGDVSRTPKLMVNIGLFGRAPNLRYIENTGVKPGDSIYLTGTTGDSRAGFELLQNTDAQIGTDNILINKHLKPEIRLSVIEKIIAAYSPAAMSDISAGLAVELKDICMRNSLGYRLNRDFLPLSEELRDYCRDLKADSLMYALSSSEEYEILFIAPPAATPVADCEGLRITRIGEITDSGYSIVCGDTTMEIDYEEIARC